MKFPLFSYFWREKNTLWIRSNINYLSSSFFFNVCVSREFTLWLETPANKKYAFNKVFLEMECVVQCDGDVNVDKMGSTNARFICILSEGTGAYSRKKAINT